MVLRVREAQDVLQLTLVVPELLEAPLDDVGHFLNSVLHGGDNKKTREFFNRRTT